MFCFVEPVSAKAPTLSGDVKWSGIERKWASSFAILCPAQAYPVPAFRYTNENYMIFREFLNFGIGIGFGTKLYVKKELLEILSSKVMKLKQYLKCHLFHTIAKVKKL